MSVSHRGDWMDQDDVDDPREDNDKFSRLTLEWNASKKKSLGVPIRRPSECE